MMNFDEVVVADLEKAYQNGRADMRKEIIQQLSELRNATLGIMQSLLTGMIEKVESLK